MHMHARRMQVRLRAKRRPLSLRFCFLPEASSPSAKTTRSRSRVSIKPMPQHVNEKCSGKMPAHSLGRLSKATVACARVQPCVSRERIRRFRHVHLHTATLHPVCARAIEASTPPAVSGTALLQGTLQECRLQHSWHDAKETSCR